MKYLLDTNICIYIINRKPTPVIESVRKHKSGEIGLSGITLSELQKGVSKSTRQDKNQQALDQFISVFTVLPFEASDAKQYGKISAELEASGRLIGGNDLFIAAHALSRQLILVTNNLWEFRRIDGLQLENWAD